MKPTLKKMKWEGNSFTVGYCKMCRQWDVLNKKHTCFECLGLTLPQQYPELFAKPEGKEGEGR
jgi:hypothetical protein